MRYSLRLLLLLLLSYPARSSAAGVEIVRVSTGWRDAASFQRLREYFDGKEHTGGITVLRSQSGERAGYYWLVRLKNEGPPLPGAKFELEVISPDAPTPKTFTFASTIPVGGGLYQLGVTGRDWPDAKARAVAWRLRLLAADGQTVIAKDSFLWALPPK